MGELLIQGQNCIGLMETSGFLSQKFLEIILSNCRSWNDTPIFQDIPLNFQWRGWKLCHLLQQALFNHPTRQFLDSTDFGFYADPRYTHLFHDMGLLICERPYDLIAGSVEEMEIRICTQLILEKGYALIMEQHPTVSRMHFQKYFEDFLLYKEIRPLYSSKTLCY